MLAAEHCSEFFTDVALPNHELLEINRSKISLHRAKAGYHYPTIQLPHTFSQLAGLSTRIYQTIYDGSLAFLTVKRQQKTLQTPLNPPSSHGGGRRFEFGRAHLFSGDFQGATFSDETGLAKRIVDAIKAK
jgi:hypothetical protein